MTGATAMTLRGLVYAGALHDPVAALVFCAPGTVAFSVIDGRVIVAGGRFTHFDAAAHAQPHNRLAFDLCGAQ
jgi:8-oxoguanine deaminase